MGWKSVHNISGAATVFLMASSIVPLGMSVHDFRAPRTGAPTLQVRSLERTLEEETARYIDGSRDDFPRDVMERYAQAAIAVRDSPRDDPDMKAVAHEYTMLSWKLLGLALLVAVPGVCAEYVMKKRSRVNQY